MKKILYTVAIAAIASLGLHAGSDIVRNHNVLGRAPVFKEFAKPAPKASVAMPAIVASVYDYNDNTIGMYEIPSEANGVFNKLSDVSSYYGGSIKGDIYYACHDGRYGDDGYWDTDSDPHGHKIQGYNIDGWTAVGPEINVSTYRASDMAINPTNGLAYAFCDYGAMMYSLYSIDLATGEQEVHASGSTMFPEETSRALAFNADGVLYGVTKNGYFGTVNLETGVNSKAVNLNVSGDLKHNWTAAFDPDNGNFIFICNYAETSTKHKSVIYSINPITGEKTELVTFEDKCITSMYIDTEKVADNAPAAVSSVNSAFENGSLSGSISFTMPSILSNGDAATGNAVWSIEENKEVIASGTAAMGSSVQANIAASEAGKHIYTIYVTNDNGKGAKTRYVCWVGPDVPCAPENVQVVYDEDSNTFAVSWNAVTTGVNSGWIAADDISYTVVRNPGNVTVAQNIKETAFTDTYTPQGIENITYSVTAAHGDNVSEAGVSESLATGTLALPYLMSEAAGRNNYGYDWTIIDNNADGKTWETQSTSVVYNYSSTETADEWLISPPIMAAAGNKYFVKVTAYAQMSSYVERIEAKAGYAPTAEAMTVAALDTTVVNQTMSAPQIIEFEVTATQNGKLYIGLHCVSEADKYKLTLKDVAISAPVSLQSPGEVTDFVAVAAKDGSLSVSCRGKAPLKASDGTDLSSNVGIKVLRNGVVVFETENVAPGAEFTFDDNDIASEGIVSYTALATQGNLSGKECAEFKTYVGISSPGVCTDVKLVYNEADNTMTASWKAPEVGYYGYPLNGEKTYCVEVFPDNAYYHGNVTHKDITETSYTFTPTFDGGEDHGMVYVKVYAENSKGAGFGVKSENLPFGKALTLPFTESFPNYTLEHPWGDGASNGPQIASISDDERSINFQQFNGWNRLMDRSFNSADGAQDGDNGFAGMFGWSYVCDSEGNYYDEWTELISPRIDLGDEAHPMLSFYTFNWLNYNGLCLNEIEVSVVCEGQRNVEKTVVVGDLGTTQCWEYVAVDLTKYAGKTIYLIFKGTIKADGDYGYNWILLDNIRIDKAAATDLAVEGISAPVVAEPGSEFTVKARVSNIGGGDVAEHTVTLFKNNKVVEVRELGTLAFSTSEIVEFNTSLSVTDPIANEFYIEVSTEGDNEAENNLTNKAIVARNLLVLPEPLDVTYSPDTKVMSWTAPDLSTAAPAPYLDDFEDYGDFEGVLEFATEAGDWVFVDLDKKPIGGIISASTYEFIEFPGIPTHSTQSWWVQSRMFEDFDNGYMGYSGVQYLANMYVVNDAFNAAEHQDDWAISPLLCGRQQLISLWAKSYDRYTPEKLEFYYSDGPAEPDDFTLITTVNAVPGDWTNYVFAVPEGARRFAIRGCSYAYMGTNQCFIDDVTFVPAEGEPQELELIGYNLYKDNEKVNDEPQKAVNFAVDADPEEHVYAVSAVYDKGESRAIAIGEENGVENVNTSNITISAGNGQITISGLVDQSYSVTNTIGIVVAADTASGSVSIPVTPGIYLVTVNFTTTKVVVK